MQFSQPTPVSRKRTFDTYTFYDFVNDVENGQISACYDDDMALRLDALCHSLSPSTPVTNMGSNPSQPPGAFGSNMVSFLDTLNSDLYSSTRQTFGSQIALPIQQGFAFQFQSTDPMLSTDPLQSDPLFGLFPSSSSSFNGDIALHDQALPVATTGLSLPPIGAASQPISPYNPDLDGASPYNPDLTLHFVTIAQSAPASTSTKIEPAKSLTESDLAAADSTAAAAAPTTAPSAQSSAGSPGNDGMAQLLAAVGQMSVKDSQQDDESPVDAALNVRKRHAALLRYLIQYVSNKSKVAAC
ncbi:uncharacterized protein BJ171DRAFT_220631 [Polychytrium aggregatum]|uniref:uncharacterized protein n=1 Tax=Polychytrium aggregatum TaxID=110093 RepID=UPI0022FE9705|nr:uncharacterized protein BJ171DRAFT_220631 [Polychytrium aggregatum]KAI9197441.1 hypothetical protein BJ171DRAFT_220631 [Polychytrium aggregatum]